MIWRLNVSRYTGTFFHVKETFINVHLTTKKHNFNANNWFFSYSCKKKIATKIKKCLVYQDLWLMCKFRIPIFHKFNSLWRNVIWSIKTEKSWYGYGTMAGYSEFRCDITRNCSLQGKKTYAYKRHKDWLRLGYRIM